MRLLVKVFMLFIFLYVFLGGCKYFVKSGNCYTFLLFAIVGHCCLHFWSIYFALFNFFFCLFVDLLFSSWGKSSKQFLINVDTFFRQPRLININKVWKNTLKYLCSNALFFPPKKRLKLLFSYNLFKFLKVLFKIW